MKVLRGIAVCTLGMFLLVGVRLAAVSERDSDKQEDVRISVETRGSPQVVVYATRA